MAESDQRPPLTLIEAVIPIAGLIILVGLSYYLFGDAGASGPLRDARGRGKGAAETEGRRF